MVNSYQSRRALGTLFEERMCESYGERAGDMNVRQTRINIAPSTSTAIGLCKHTCFSSLNRMLGLCGEGFFLLLSNLRYGFMDRTSAQKFT